MLAPYRAQAAIAYTVVSLSLLLATALRFSLDPWLGDHLSFSFFFLAVAVAAWVGGVWPALVTAFLSCLIGNYFFTHPAGNLSIDTHEEFFSLSLFVIVSLVIGILSEMSLRALERAKRAEEAKDEFMATLAHELRSPLSVIHYANTLHRMLGNREPSDHADVIERQVQRLNFMIQDLLDVSRVARGMVRLDRQHIDASVAVEGAVERARPLIESRRHTLEVDVSDETMPLYADPVRLEQVLSNLLTNAAKYTPDSGQILISAHPVAECVIFTVRDNGIGISEEMLPRVFGMFVQAEAENPAAEGGLGIGLALVRKLVEMHGGTVQATSAGPNRGSEFVVSLPLAQPAESRRSLVEA